MSEDVSARASSLEGSVVEVAMPGFLTAARAEMGVPLAARTDLERCGPTVEAADEAATALMGLAAGD